MSDDFQTLPISLEPGLYSERSKRGAGMSARWDDGDFVRFKTGLPEKMGGWISRTLTGDIPILGFPRGITDWTALDGTSRFAFGTDKKLYLVKSDALNDITPLRDQGSLTNPISTNVGGGYDPFGGSDAKFFNMSHTAHTLAVGDYVRLGSGTDTETPDPFDAVGGITVSGEYIVQAVTGSNDYILKHGSAATSTAGPGGGVGSYEYDIPSGAATSEVLFGFGAGGYGMETWGTARTESSGTISLALRAWSLDAWGEDLIASPSDGAIYVWDKTNGDSVRGVVIANAPATNRHILVSPENRQIISLGAHDGSTQDPLLIAWCDNEDYTDWTPTVSNRAGSQRIDDGSTKIITGIRSRTSIVIWTDLSMHIMTPVAGNDVYTVRHIGTGTTIVSPYGAVDVNGIVYYMGVSNFYVYDGTLRILPCDLWSKVFNDFNFSQKELVFASRNKEFSEIWFFYPSEGQTANDRAVIYNYKDGSWYYASIVRAVYHDYSGHYEKPYALNEDGTLYQHETGVDDDGSAITAFLRSGEMDLSEGKSMMAVDQLVPDFETLIGSVDVELTVRRYPADSLPVTDGPYTVNATTEKVDVRARGRQISIKITSDALSDDWRMDDWTAAVKEDGGR